MFVTHETGVGGTSSTQIKVTSPKTNDFVTGNVTIFAQPTGTMPTVESNATGSYTAMDNTNSVYTSTIATADSFYAQKR